VEIDPNVFTSRRRTLGVLAGDGSAECILDIVIDHLS
jgi:hypothetical protein